MRLSLVANKPLSKGMIIFFDEIQEVKDFITKIKFWWMMEHTNMYLVDLY